MSKSERQFIAMFVGMILILIGVMVMLSGAAGSWSIEVVASKITRIIVGSFVFAVGAIFLAFGIGEDITDFMESVWDRFLDALGR